MHRVILATKSKARQRLLRQIGLKFLVAKPSIKENRSLKSECSKLVIDNALRKARDVAGRFSSGVVIAADTVVLVGKRIVGKPRSRSDAFKTLKLLSQRPQWVFTGLAVIRIDDNRIFTSYDKTKLYMCPLSDKQISSYFEHNSPFDKSGGFDIQGRGSVYINRIEGCFYNVIGLPLAKLAKILEKLGIDVYA